VAEAAQRADRLRFDLGSDLGYRYPGAEDAQAMRKLTELCEARLHDRYSGCRARLRDAGARLGEELRIIESLGLAGFFLLHHDMLELAREVAIEVRGPDTARALLPPGRGRAGPAVRGPPPRSRARVGWRGRARNRAGPRRRPPTAR